MVLKRYIVDNMQEGMEKIKKELGSDAVILSSKEIKKKGLKGLFSKPKMEIVAAYDDKDTIEINTPARANPYRTQKSGRSVPSASARTEYTGADMVKLESKISNIDNMLNTFLQRFNDDNYNDKFAGYSKEVRGFATKLLENEVREDIVYRLADQVGNVVRTENIDEEAAIEKVVSGFVGEKSPIVLKKRTPTIIMFLGTTGVGKTTTLSKLATMFTMQKEKQAAIITVDTYKIASSEQLRIYSDILNVPFTVAYSNEEANDAVKEYADKDIIFIDTGKCPDENEYRKNITELIGLVSPDEIYIVVSASTNYKFCAKIIDDYAYVEDFKFIVTKMDEAMCFGTIFNLRSVASKPIAYLTYGQVLTEDIREFTPEYILDSINKVSEE
jgi:flagellar biosynthesis protein FlhF